MIIANTIVFHSQIICTFQIYQLNSCTVNFGLDLDFGYWILDSGFLSVEFGFGIPIVSGIPVSLSLNSKAQDSTSKTYTGIRNPDFLTWGVEI